MGGKVRVLLVALHQIDQFGGYVNCALQSVIWKEHDVQVMGRHRHPYKPQWNYEGRCFAIRDLAFAAEV